MPGRGRPDLQVRGDVALLVDAHGHPLLLSFSPTPQARPAQASARRLTGQAVRTQPAAMETVTLRPFTAEDADWLIARHGALYAEHEGFDASFAVLVADIIADFLAHQKPGREEGWIAWRGAERLGSTFVVEEDARTAKLRLVCLNPRRGALGWRSGSWTRRWISPAARATGPCGSGPMRAIARRAGSMPGTVSRWWRARRTLLRAGCRGPDMGARTLGTDPGENRREGRLNGPHAPP